MLGCVPLLARRSAGRLVRARVERFSTDVLGAEVACSGAIGRRFDALAVTAGLLTRAAWHRCGGQPGPDPQLRVELAALAAQALVRCRPDVTRLLRIGVDLALESIGDELGHCEAALPARHAGTARAGVAAAEEQTSRLTDAALTGYAVFEPAALVALDADLVQQLSLSRQRGEPVETLLARLTRPEPAAGTPGLTGRGVWYRPATAARAQARTVLYGLANSVREAAMAGMNAAAN